MSEKHGISETEDVIVAAVELGNAVGKGLEDGSLGLSDLAEFGKAAMSLPAAIAGIGKVPDELADLDEKERIALISLVEARLEVPGDKAEAIAIDSLKLIAHMHSFASTHFMKKDE